MNESVIIMRIVKDCNILSPQEIVSKYKPLIQDYVYDTIKTRNYFSQIEIQGTHAEAMSRLIDDVCKVYDIKRSHLLVQNRNRELVLVRHMISFIARMLDITTWKDIGQILGGRDHTTAMHGYSTFKDLLSTNNRPALINWSKWIKHGNPEFTKYFDWAAPVEEEREAVVIHIKPQTVYNNIPVYNYAE